MKKFVHNFVQVAPKMLEERAFHSRVSSLEFMGDNILVCVSASDHSIEQWKNYKLTQKTHQHKDVV